MLFASEWILDSESMKVQGVVKDIFEMLGTKIIELNVLAKFYSNSMTAKQICSFLIF